GLSFDAALDLGDGQAVEPVMGGEFLLVQALTTSGAWASLNVRLLGAGAPAFPMRAIAGQGLVHVTANLGADGNELLGLAATTRVRLVLQTNEGESNEDGQTRNTRGAAVVDNLRVDDPLGSVIAPVDFEDGSTGPWALSALNGAIFERECIE